MSVWDDIDRLVAGHKATAASLKALGNENKCGTRPSTLNAVHWVAKCRRRDCGEEMIGTAEELPKAMATHGAACDARKKKAAAAAKAARAAERRAESTPKKSARAGGR